MVLKRVFVLVFSRLNATAIVRAVQSVAVVAVDSAVAAGG